MTTREQNDFLTLTGPGTPMGDLLRRYWIPALLASELPEPDCPPVRVKLLGERLIAFRDTQGRVGAHGRVLRPSRRLAVVRPQRGERAALPLSRLEIRRHRPVRRGALRAGRERLLPSKIKLTSYPCVELGDVDLDLYGAAGAQAAAAGVRMGARSRARIASSPSAPRTATGCRRWKAASIRSTSRSCTATICAAIRSMSARAPNSPARPTPASK